MITKENIVWSKQSGSYATIGYIGETWVASYRPNINDTFTAYCSKKLGIRTMFAEFTESSEQELKAKVEKFFNNHNDITQIIKISP